MAASNEEEVPVVVGHRVAVVTVYEDRADVVRRADVELDAGAHVLVFKNLSPLIDEDRLVARVEGSGHVDDVSVVRHYVDDGADAIRARRVARAQERAKLNEARQARVDEVDLAKKALISAQSALSSWSKAQARRIGRGASDVDIDVSFSLFRNNIEQASNALIAGQAEVTRLDAKMQKLDLDDQRPEPSTLRRVCDVVVRVSSPGGKSVIVVTTVLPCAAWRPTHEARLLRHDAPKVRLTTHGAVWNRTGEIWNNTRLVLSTARPSLGAELPQLSEDRLRLRQKTAEEKKTVFIEHRIERVPPSASQGGAPGVDDGGEARVFGVDTIDIPDDGRPHNVELQSFEVPCALARVCMPEKAPQVFVRASFKNGGRAPILAGPVTLVDNGAWTGTGDIFFCGVGDDVDLSFGSDDRYSVRLEKKVIVEKRTLSKDISHYLQEATITSTASSSAASSEPIQVILRLPVSEVAQVKVLLSPQHGTEQNIVADSHGLVRVNASIDGARDKRVAIAFSFDTSGDVHIPAPW